ncbi:HD-GYP domain-containing protein [Christensenellaceae bacterium OttesenSCG-928-K19]|nr:HD-GYP domain-containing protein [Christensenellaceae bacterium OttesenSCG-928-K19]
MLFIPMSQLKSGMKLANDVLVFEHANVRLLKRGMVLSQNFIDRLHRFDVSGVYVKDELTGDIIPSQPIMSKRLKTNTLNNLEWVFKRSTEKDSKKGTKKYIQHLDDTVIKLIDLVKENESKLVNINDLKAYDEYTYHHSLSVAVIAIGIGMQLGISQDELHRLGFAAIMHDIGKMEIPIEIINKPAKLTTEEFEIIKKHPVYGGEYLALNDVNDQGIYDGVVHHHEMVNGTGYPNNLPDREIPFFSKIISVADVYDALTSHRPYRDPLLPTHVAEYMMGNCGIAFDMDIVKAFLNKIEFFPVGSFVEFNNEKKAVVINNENPLHPLVRLIEPPFSTLDLFNDPSTYSMVITKLFEEFPVADLKMASG